MTFLTICARPLLQLYMYFKRGRVRKVTLKGQNKRTEEADWVLEGQTKGEFAQAI